jgi:hypothetical protein
MPREYVPGGIKIGVSRGLTKKFNLNYVPKPVHYV